MPPRKRGGRRATTKQRGAAARSPSTRFSPSVDDSPSTAPPTTSPTAAPDSDTPVSAAADSIDSPAPSLSCEIPSASVSADPALPSKPLQTPAEAADTETPVSVAAAAAAAHGSTPEPAERAAADPDVRPSLGTPEPSGEDALTEEEQSEKKGATLVRKVIKKKIVRKRVVKVSSLAENEGEKSVAEEVGSAEVGNGQPAGISDIRSEEIVGVQQIENMDAQPSEAIALKVETPAPVSHPVSGNPSMDAAIGSGKTAKQEAMDMEILDSEEKKDVLVEQNKVGDEARVEPVILGDEKKNDIDKVEGDKALAQSATLRDEEMKDVDKVGDKGAEPVIMEDKEKKDVLAEQDKIEGDGVPADPVIPGSEEKKYASADQGKLEGDEAPAGLVIPEDEEAGISERRKRRRTEIFIGGLDREVKEEDLRKVFTKVGEIVEIRMMMDRNTGKNKGYAFLRYKEPAHAQKAVSEFSKVEICGKLCGAAALEGNDTIFLGNIDKKWKKEDVMGMLEDIGIEKIDTITVMVDPNNTDLNRGFAFLELESNRDAQIAFKKLQQNAFGKGRNIRVAWAEPLNDPDEEEMQKVKSVYLEGISSSWDEAKVRQIFEKFGEIERVVLARNMPSAKRKDFAFVNYTSREAALSCIESFEKEELTENGLKINVKVSLSKPQRKGKQNVGVSKSTSTSTGKEKHRAAQYKGKHPKGGPVFSGGDKRSSMTNEYSHGFRDQAAWRQGQIGYPRGPVMPGYPPMAGGKRAFSAMGDGTYSDYRGYPRPRFEGSFPAANSSYNTYPQGIPGSSQPYYHQRPDGGYQGAPYNQGGYAGTSQRQGFPPYGGNNMFPRY